MPWPRYSKIASRRNLRRLFTLGLAILPLPLFAQLSHQIDIRTDDQMLELTITATGASLEELRHNLDDGLTAGVEMVIRISEPRRPPFRFMGDRLIREFRPGARAHWDAFAQRYVVQADDGSRYAVSSIEELARILFSLIEYRIPWNAMEDRSGALPEQLVVETQVTYIPVVFVRALTILLFFPPNERVSSSWVRTPIGREAM
jgi:hypothetical protein